MSQADERHHYMVLDAMRGIAAIAVVWFHLHFVVGYDSAGPLAVDFFFMLSGFVVASAYDSRLENDLNISKFILKRVIRMYPLFLLGLIIALVVQELLILKGLSVLDERQTLLSFILELFWAPSPFGPNGYTFPIDGPAWSLSFEVLVNILYAIFHKRLNNIYLLMIITIAGCVIVSAIWILGSVNFGWSWVTLLLGLARVLFSFPVGILLWRYRSKIPDVFVNVSPAILLCALGAVLILPETWFSDIIFLTVGAPLLIVMGFRAKYSQESRIFGILGETSYPLYALHGATILIIQGLVKRLGLGYFGVPIALSYLIIMLLISRVFAVWDRRVRRSLEKVMRRDRHVGGGSKALI